MRLPVVGARTSQAARPGGVAERLVAHLEARALAAHAEDVRIGLGYTAVALDAGRVGLGYTFRDAARPGCSARDGERPLAGSPAAELLALAVSGDPIEAGIGIACANALSGEYAPGKVAGDVLEHLDVRSSDDVAMVGHFGPLIGPLRLRARSLAVFERDLDRAADVRPQDEAAAALGRCQVALLTSTAIINGTIDGLLEAARGCREVVLLGASTPLCPGIFEGGPVTLLSGVVVAAPGEVLKVVSEGGGVRQLGPHLRKVVLRLR